jgi:exonuclease VII large subunit
LYEKKDALRDYAENIEGKFRSLFERFHRAEEKLKRNLIAVGSSISRVKERTALSGKNLPIKLEEHLRRMKERFAYAEKMIAINSPMRQLRLGYSLAFANGKVIRKTEDVKIGEEINIRVENGMIHAKVE